MVEINKLSPESKKRIFELLLLFGRYQKDFDNDIEINVATDRVFESLIKENLIPEEKIQKIEYKREQVILPLIKHIKLFNRDLAIFTNNFISPIRAAFKKREIPNINFYEAIAMLDAMKNSQYIEELPDYYHIGLNVLEITIEILIKEKKRNDLLIKKQQK